MRERCRSYDIARFLESIHEFYRQTIRAMRVSAPLHYATIANLPPAPMSASRFDLNSVVSHSLLLSN